MLLGKLTAAALFLTVLGCAGFIQAVPVASAWDYKEAGPDDDRLRADESPDRALEDGGSPADPLILRPRPVPINPGAYRPPPKPQPSPRPKPVQPGAQAPVAPKPPATKPPVTRPS